MFNKKIERLITLVVLFMPFSILMLAGPNIKETNIIEESNILREEASLSSVYINTLEENKDALIPMLNALKNTNKIESGTIDSQIKLLTQEDNKESKYNELLTICLLSNFSTNEKDSFNLNGIFSLNIESLDIDSSFPINVNNLKEKDYEIFLEVPPSYKKAFDMTEKDKFLYINKDTIDEVKKLLEKPKEETLNEKKAYKESTRESIKNKIKYTELNEGSRVYDFDLNNEDLLYISSYIENMDESFILKGIFLKNNDIINNISSFKGQLGATNGVATDIYVEITNSSQSVIATRITFEDINNENIVVSELATNEKKKFETFLKPLLEIGEDSKSETKSKNKINIGNIYFTGEDESIKVEKFNSKNFDKTINVFINFLECTKNTNLIVKWFYENQEVPIIENKLSNGSYKEGILKTSISFKDKESIPKGNYRIQITIEGQDKIYSEAKFSIK